MDFASGGYVPFDPDRPTIPVDACGYIIPISALREYGAAVLGRAWVGPDEAA